VVQPGKRERKVHGSVGIRQICQRVGSIRPVQHLYATVLEIPDADDVTLSDIAKRAIRWSARGAGHIPPDLAPGVHMVEGPNNQTIRWEILAATDGPERAFELTWTHPDRTQETLAWQNRIEAVLAGGVCRITVRLARESTDFVLTPAPVTLIRPALVAELLREHQCTIGGIPVSPDGAVLMAGDVSGWLHKVLRNPARTIPVILLAGPRNKSPQQASSDLGDTLAGVAIVVSLGSRLAWEAVRDELGFLATPPYGGARLYWPGFGTRSALRHRWYTATDLANDWFQFKQRIFRTLSRLSTVRVPRSAVLERLARAERDRRLAALQERADPEIIDLYEQEIHQLEARAQEMEDDLAQKAQILENQELELLHWRTGGRADVFAPPEEEVEDEESRLESTIDAVIELAQSIDDWADVPDLADQLQSDAFRFTDQVRSQLAGNTYANPGRMLLFLARLALAALEYRRLGGAVGDRLQDWISSYELDISLHDQARQGSRFDYEDSTYSDEPHVKVDDNKPRNECGRIYFAPDAEHARFIVNYVGAHP